MTTAEQVTDFALRVDEWKTPTGVVGYHAQAVEAYKAAGVSVPEKIELTVKMAKVKDLLKALTKYCKSKGLEPDEYGFNLAPSVDPRYGNKEPFVPQKYWNLIAFWVEGGSEGYYVHVGAIVQNEKHGEHSYYHDFGFAKTYGVENAQGLAREAQRFLTAAAWN